MKLNSIFIPRTHQGLPKSDLQLKAGKDFTINQQKNSKHYNTHKNYIFQLGDAKGFCTVRTFYTLRACLILGQDDISHTSHEFNTVYVYTVYYEGKKYIKEKDVDLINIHNLTHMILVECIDDY